MCILIFFQFDNENSPGLVQKHLQNIFWHCVVVSASKTEQYYSCVIIVLSAL